ncbi:HBS1-like protein isoform X1 [Tetranychus urticae]|uniref:HBS1-like protein isoform X1 n=1 Tax=Tetranychus urticae TaxID=32264 RepID=UPI00077BBCAF|nr:HBS1-like protein isoform X1 [Tetranychus urticae]
MARHRNIRGLNYDEEYDDVYNSTYGTSVEDDYCISPGTEAQFTYNRGGSRDDSRLSGYLQNWNRSGDIQEETNDETDSPVELDRRPSDGSIDNTIKFLDQTEQVQLQSCVLELQNVVGETVPESILKEKALKHRFDVEKALDEVLNPSKWKMQSNAQTKVKISEPKRPEIKKRQEELDTKIDKLLESFLGKQLKMESSSSTSSFHNHSKVNSLSSSKQCKNSITTSPSTNPTSADSKTCIAPPLNFILDLDDGHISLTSKIDNVRLPNFVITLTARYKPDLSRIVNPRIGLKERLVEYHKQQAFKSFDFLTPSPDDLRLNRRSGLTREPVEHVATDVPDEVAARLEKKAGKESPQVKAVDRLRESLHVDKKERKKSPAAVDRSSPSGPQVIGAAKNQVKIISKESVIQEFTKERLGKKTLINLVVVGHVDAGKSTLMGHLLYRLGQVSKKNMHRYETDSKKIGKASFLYAWVLDETDEERNRGITMDIAQSSFETATKSVNLLDAPGHRDFIPNMITGAAQADAALLVIDATNGEFEAGFEAGGQTREHTLLIRSLGVSQLAVVVNKLDNVNWSKQRFDEIVGKLTPFLKQAGYKDHDVTFVPCSGLTGENLNERSKNPSLTAWYSGLSLVEVIDAFKAPERPVSKPFRLSIGDVFKGLTSGVCISGRIESGAVQLGQKLIVMPSGEQAVVKAISVDDNPLTQAFAGDQIALTLTGCDVANIATGNILCDLTDPSPATTRFLAKIVVFNNVQVPLTKGVPVVLHCKNLQEQVTIRKLVSQVNKSTGQVMKAKPRCLPSNTSGIVEIESSRPISIELYQEYKDLGRIMLRSRGTTVAAGLVVQIL